MSCQARSSAHNLESYEVRACATISLAWFNRLTTCITANYVLVAWSISVNKCLGSRNLHVYLLYYIDKHTWGVSWGSWANINFEAPSTVLSRSELTIMQRRVHVWSRDKIYQRVTWSISISISICTTISSSLNVNIEEKDKCEVKVQITISSITYSLGSFVWSHLLSISTLKSVLRKPARFDRSCLYKSKRSGLVIYK